jgi:hypothetical protein
MAAPERNNARMIRLFPTHLPPLRRRLVSPAFPHCESTQLIVCTVVAGTMMSQDAAAPTTRPKVRVCLFLVFLDVLDRMEWSFLLLLGVLAANLYLAELS